MLAKKIALAAAVLAAVATCGHSLTIGYSTLPSGAYAKGYLSKEKALIRSQKDAKYFIINSVEGSKARSALFPGYPKACFMERSYDTCLISNIRNMANNEKISIKEIPMKPFGFTVAPKGFSVEGKYLFVVFTVSKKEKKLTNREKEALKRIPDILESAAKIAGVEKVNAFAIGDFGVPAKTLSSLTGLTHYFDEPNRVKGRKAEWVSNILGFAPKSYVRAKADYGFVGLTQRNEKDTFGTYGKTLKFIPMKITVPVKE